MPSLQSGDRHGKDQTTLEVRQTDKDKYTSGESDSKMGEKKRHFDFTVTWNILIAGWGLLISDKRKSGVKMMMGGGCLDGQRCDSHSQIKHLWYFFNKTVRSQKAIRKGKNGSH